MASSALVGISSFVDLSLPKLDMDSFFEGIPKDANENGEELDYLSISRNGSTPEFLGHIMQQLNLSIPGPVDNCSFVPESLTDANLSSLQSFGDEEIDPKTTDDSDEDCDNCCSYASLRAALSTAGSMAPATETYVTKWLIEFKVLAD